jgi:prevent-host-death family protein
MARKPTKLKKPPAVPRRAWPVQEARAKLSALIDEALTGKPQRITRNGKDTVVVVREADFAPTSFKTTKEWFKAFQNSPLTEALEEGLIDFDAMRRESPLGPAIDFSEDSEDR